MSVFYKDTRQVIVSEGSDYYIPLGCRDDLDGGECQVDVYTYVDVFFGGLFSRDNIRRNAIILAMILFVVRMSTFLALRFFTYSGK